MEEIKLNLDEVIIDNGLNPREGALDQEAVLEYAEHLDDLPPMIVFYLPGGEHLLVAGFHRIAAHRLAGAGEGRFLVQAGSREEAHEFADLDNLKHGLRLTRREKRAVIGRYLKRHSNRSDVWVAKECYTTDKTVRSVREELEATSEIPKHDILIDVNGIERPRSAPRPAMVVKEFNPPPLPALRPPDPPGTVGGRDPGPMARIEAEFIQSLELICEICGDSQVCQVCMGTGKDPVDPHQYCPDCGPNGADGKCIHCAGPDPDAELELEAEAASQEEPGGDDADVYDAEPTPPPIPVVPPKPAPPPPPPPPPVVSEAPYYCNITIRSDGCLVSLWYDERQIATRQGSQTELGALVQELIDERVKFSHNGHEPATEPVDEAVPEWLG